MSNGETIYELEQLRFSLTGTGDSPNHGEIESATHRANWAWPPKLVIKDVATGRQRVVPALTEDSTIIETEFGYTGQKILYFTGRAKLVELPTSGRPQGAPPRGPLFPHLDLQWTLNVNRWDPARDEPVERQRAAAERQPAQAADRERRAQARTKRRLARARPGVLNFNFPSEVAVNNMSEVQFEDYSMQLHYAIQATPPIDMRPRHDTTWRKVWHVERVSNGEIHVYPLLTPRQGHPDRPDEFRALQQQIIDQEGRFFHEGDWLVVIRDDSRQRILLTGDQLATQHTIETIFGMLEPIFFVADVLMVIETLGAAPALFAAARRALLAAITRVARLGAAASEFALRALRRSAARAARAMAGEVAAGARMLGTETTAHSVSLLERGLAEEGLAAAEPAAAEATGAGVVEGEVAGEGLGAIELGRAQAMGRRAQEAFYGLPRRVGEIVDELRDRVADAAINNIELTALLADLSGGRITAAGNRYHQIAERTIRGLINRGSFPGYTIGVETRLEEGAARLDLFIRSPESELYVFDWKPTARSAIEYPQQMARYRRIIQETYRVRVTGVRSLHWLDDVVRALERHPNVLRRIRARQVRNFLIQQGWREEALQDFDRALRALDDAPDMERLTEGRLQ